MIIQVILPRRNSQHYSPSKIFRTQRTQFLNFVRRYSHKIILFFNPSTFSHSFYKPLKVQHLLSVFRIILSFTSIVPLLHVLFYGKASSTKMFKIYFTTISPEYLTNESKPRSTDLGLKRRLFNLKNGSWPKP
jgi:hypothetical protein